MCKGLGICVTSQAIRLLKDMDFMICVLQSPCGTQAGTSAANDGYAFLLG
jgi:hypothetical protein